ncbi:MAG: cadherin-like beta sandwich domain-containing protein [Treponema sp.]|nr:cadherin-like beta sandwich domain-containing protein [Treponema sp.]
MKKGGKAALLLAAAFVLAGCSNGMNDGANVNGKYGSITINSGESISRKLEISELSTATVSVLGYGMETISKSGVSLNGGEASVTISDIPVGNNRVVKVTSNLTGVVLYARCNIMGGNNDVDVNWASTAEGRVFYHLIEKGVNVSNIDASVFASAIPGDIHACLVDCETIASDYAEGGSSALKAASAYKLSAGSVSVSVYGYKGKTIKIADPASSAQVPSSDFETLTFSGVMPGKWNVYADGKKNGSVSVSGGGSESIQIGHSGYRVHLYNANWSSYSVYAYKDDSTGDTWPGNAMTEELNGHFIDLTQSWVEAGSTYVIFYGGDNTNRYPFDGQPGVQIPAEVNEAWYNLETKEWSTENPFENQLSSDATLSSINVNGVALEGFDSETTSYSAGIASGVTSASVTATANDSGASVSVSPNGSASISEGESRVFTITVTAEDGVTVKTYTVSVKRAAANDISLASVSVNGKSASINGAAVTYSAKGKNDTFAVTSITATPVDANATVTYSATTGTVADGASKNFTITVKNGTKTATYTLTVSYTKQVSSGQYGTNDKGYGVNKTISSWSDWTEDMQIARGASYDDPRTWMGIQETAYDAYALYAAYDDTNLYLMVELTNLPDNRASFMNHNYAGSDNAWWDNRDCPLGFIINTGKGTTATAPLVGSASGKPIWNAINFTDSEGFDFLFYGSSKYGYADHKSAFVGVGTPGLFKLNSSTGYFSYDAEYCMSANSGAPGAETPGTSGISVRYIRQCQVSSTVNFESTPSDNRATSGQSGDDLMESETYTSVETNDLDMSYWYTIPLATLGIDKAYIQSNGIGVRQLTPNGGSLMDCLPWDVSMVDNATEPCSDDESTSHEKEDKDDITSAQARIGK